MVDSIRIPFIFLIYLDHFRPKVYSGKCYVSFLWKMNLRRIVIRDFVGAPSIVCKSTQTIFFINGMTLQKKNFGR